MADQKTSLHLTDHATYPQIPGISPLPAMPPKGIGHPVFLPPLVIERISPLYNLLNSLKIATSTPNFTEDTREFLIDTIERALYGTEPQLDGDESPPPQTYIAPAIQIRKNADGETTTNDTPPMEIQWAARLIQSARRDIARPTCSSWSDLMLYCRYAAEPLGRTVLEACEIRDSPEIESATDSLCAALLVQNLMRHARQDWLQHGRCFIPLDWIREENGSPEQLVETSLSPALKRVRDRMLSRTEHLIKRAATLPQLLVNFPPLKAETTRLIVHARYQHHQLRRKDMLTHQLTTPRWVRLIAHLEGWLAGRA